MTKQQVQWVSLCAEFSRVARDKVGWEQMGKAASLDGKTTDWWKVTDSFVLSHRYIEVLLYCHCVTGVCVNDIVHTGTRAGMLVMKKWRHCKVKTALHASCHYKDTRMKQVTATYYWTVLERDNFKEELQKASSSIEEHPTVFCLL